MIRELRRLSIAAVAVAVALSGNAGGAATDAASKAIVFKLNEKHDSSVSGAATLSAAGTGVRVVLQLRGPVRGRPVAHIHTGPCRREPTFANPRIWLSLNDVARRRSVTETYRTTLAQLRSRSFSINVHDPNTLGVIACGDIPRGG